ncbi:MAG: class I SAM-dependent methyltransferase [Pseudomonadales bacterium]
MSKPRNPNLEDAYSVKTPEDNKELYSSWSASYDSGFAMGRGYIYPQQIAKQYSQIAQQDDGPILDVGAGTGLVAEALLKNCSRPIDAIDISKEMLDAAAAKKVYQRLILADLSQTIPIEDGVYGAVVSAGTFTHGHVGPSAINELLRIAKPGALFCLGINGTAFDKYGFGSAFARLSSEELIESLRFSQVQYYEKAEDEHADDRGYVAIFRKPA